MFNTMINIPYMAIRFALYFYGLFSCYLTGWYNYLEVLRIYTSQFLVVI